MVTPLLYFTCTWVPTSIDKGGGHLRTPGKVEKCYRIKKNISEFSLNGLNVIGPTL